MGQFQQGSQGPSGKGKGGSNPATSGQAQIGQPNQAAQAQPTSVDAAPTPANVPVNTPSPISSFAPTSGVGKGFGGVTNSGDSGQASAFVPSMPIRAMPTPLPANDPTPVNQPIQQAPDMAQQQNVQPSQPYLFGPMGKGMAALQPPTPTEDISNQQPMNPNLVRRFGRGMEM